VKISLIAAVSSNNVIGFQNRLPWYLPEDLKYFKQLTIGKPILMGRKTFESIGRVLPGRINIVVTRNKQYQIQDCLVFSDIDDALQAFADYPEIMVIGGASFYQQMLPIADTLYLTVIDRVFDGDTHFPSFDISVWNEYSSRTCKQETDPYLSYTFKIYRKKNPELSSDSS
jgi:dihydrofolate reductase